MKNFYFPSSYYIESRYNSLLDFSLYVLKYWIILFCFLNPSFRIFDLFTLLLYLIIYFSIYDYFCYRNDINAKNEELATLRITTGVIPKIKYLLIYILLSIIFLIYFDLLFGWTILLLTSIIPIFITHNKLENKLRPITYGFLYVIKIFILYSVAYGFMDNKVFSQALVVSFLYNLVYIIAYWRKKNNLSKLSNLKLHLIRLLCYGLMSFFIINWFSYGLVLICMAFIFHYFIQKTHAF